MSKKMSWSWATLIAEERQKISDYLMTHPHAILDEINAEAGVHLPSESALRVARTALRITVPPIPRHLIGLLRDNPRLPYDAYCKKIARQDQLSQTRFKHYVSRWNLNKGLKTTTSSHRPTQADWTQLARAIARTHTLTYDQWVNLQTGSPKFSRIEYTQLKHRMQKRGWKIPDEYKAKPSYTDADHITQSPAAKYDYNQAAQWVRANPGGSGTQFTGETGMPPHVLYGVRRKLSSQGATSTTSQPRHLTNNQLYKILYSAPLDNVPEGALAFAEELLAGLCKSLNQKVEVVVLERPNRILEVRGVSR